MTQKAKPHRRAPAAQSSSKTYHTKPNRPTLLHHQTFTRKDPRDANF